MQSRGAAKYLALTLIGVMLLDVGSLTAVVVTGAPGGLHDRLPTYQEQLILFAAELGRRLEGLA